VISSLRPIGAVCFYTLRELSRRKTLYFLVGGGAGLILHVAIGVALARANFPLPSNDLSGFVLLQMSGLVSLFAWLAAVTISVSLVHQDLETGSAVSIFSKPISRLGYTLGKLLAGAAALLLVVLILAVGTQLLVLTNGGGHEGPLLKTFALIAANQFTQMLVIVVLTVLMNNIVAGVIGVVIVQLTKGLGGLHVVLHVIIDQGGGTGTVHAFSTWVDVFYWLVPRYLDSDLARDLVQAGAVGTRGQSSSLINVSGPGDVAYWAGYSALLLGLLFLAIRRREV
jgi:ABC-type transport system involved in multi-copper enzyme maturation permease subunit